MSTKDMDRGAERTMNRKSSTGKKIAAIFKKQAKETLKNKEILLQFVMFPAIAVIMESFVKVEGMPENYFVKLFAMMYIGMAPLTVMSAVIAEEKEKNTLKMLMFSDVRPWEYLIGTGSCVWMVCMAGATVFGMVGKYQGAELVQFLSVMAVGILTAMLFGAGIGTYSRTQMMATSVTVPVMLVFSFLPMLSMFNENIRKVADLVYSQQIGNLMNALGQTPDMETIVVLLVNMVCAGTLFGWAYRRCGLA